MTAPGRGTPSLTASRGSSRTRPTASLCRPNRQWQQYQLPRGQRNLHDAGPRQPGANGHRTRTCRCPESAESQGLFRTRCSILPPPSAASGSPRDRTRRPRQPFRHTVPNNPRPSQASRRRLPRRVTWRLHPQLRVPVAVQCSEQRSRVVNQCNTASDSAPQATAKERTGEASSSVPNRALDRHRWDDFGWTCKGPDTRPIWPSP